MNETEILQKENDVSAMIKTGDAFRFVSAFDKSKAYEETGEDGEVRRFVELDASSDREDLVGDVMTESALEEMEASAVGTIMLRDHDPSTESIFGVIVEAKLLRENSMTKLRIKAEVDSEDTRNVRIWKSIRKGVKLGASVTVIVLDKTANPNRKGGLLISSVKLLEISIVTIPCNQDSWTLAATASKALRIAEKQFSPEDISGTTPELETEGTTEMNQEKEQKSTSEITAPEETAAVETSDSTEETPETASEKSAGVEDRHQAVTLSRTIAAIAAHEARKAAFAENEQAPEIIDVKIEKGMFNDEMAARKPGLWDLFDILCTVKWQLMDHKWAMEVTGLEDDFDYVGAFRTAAEEFAVAATESFAYYGGFSEAASDDPDTLSMAADFEKSLTNLSELALRTTGEEKRKSLREIGTAMLAAAKTAGIPIPEAEAVEEVSAKEATPSAAATEPDDETIRKSQVFVEMEQRAAAAETALTEADEQLEIAKAGLETANALLESTLRQPLDVPKTAASS